MVTIMKSRAVTNSNEEQIFNVNLMNNILDDRDKCTSFIKEQKAFVDYYNRVYNYGVNFSLYDNVVIENYVDDKKAMQKAKGFYAHIQRLTGQKKYSKKIYGMEVQYSYFNDKYENQKLENIYIYDMFMAYLSVFKEGYYPNTDGEEFGAGIVEDNQIGFNNVLGYLEVVEPGYFATYRFERAQEPKLKKWVLDIAAKRKLYKAQERDIEAAELKTAVVIALGIISNNNIFLRAYITGTISNYIRSLIDENTLIANTDSIISIGPRDDLDIGKGLGQFKVEQANKYMVYQGSNYIIYDDADFTNPIINKWRGRVKGAQEGFNPFTKTTSTPQNYIKIGDYIYGKENNDGY